MSTSLPTLYAAKTTYLTLGKNTYRVCFSSNEQCDFPRALVAKDTTNAFGDILLDVEIEHPKGMRPMISLYFVKSKNDHGFEYRHEYGNGLDSFYDDCWVWCPENIRFLAFNSIKKDLSHPSLISGVAYKGALLPEATVEILIHRPNGELKKILEYGMCQSASDADEYCCLASRISSLGAAEKLMTILSLLKYCDFITAWMHGPCRPVVFASDTGKLMNDLSESCARDGILLALRRLMTVKKDD